MCCLLISESTSKVNVTLRGHRSNLAIKQVVQTVTFAFINEPLMTTISTLQVVCNSCLLTSKIMVTLRGRGLLFSVDADTLFKYSPSCKRKGIKQKR